MNRSVERFVSPGGPQRDEAVIRGARTALSAGVISRRAILILRTKLSALLFAATLGTLHAQPANDLFANRTLLSGTNFTVSGSLSNATSEIGEPGIAGISSGQSAWWTWTAPSNGRLTLSTAASGFNPLLGVFTGDRLDGLSLVASNAYLSCYESTNCGCHYRTRNAVNFQVAGGYTYQIAVDSALYTDTGLQPQLISNTDPVPDGAMIDWSYLWRTSQPWLWTNVVSVYVPYRTTNVLAGGEMQLGLQFTPAPKNDDFERRTVLSGSRTHITASNEGAGEQPGEPDHLGNPGGSSVWYSWTARANGRVTISEQEIPPYGRPEWRDEYGFGLSSVALLYNPIGLPPACGREIDQNPPPSFYPVFAAYTGSSLESLVSANPLPIALEDYPHAVEFDVAKGQTYQIVFDGNGGTTDRIPFHFAFTKPAPNNDFERRIRIRGIRVTATGYNAGASSQDGEPMAGDETHGKSVWWSWCAPVSGEVHICLEESDYEFPVSVFVGSSLADLQLVQSGKGEVSFQALAGQKYEIVVSDHDGNTGKISFSLYAPEVEAPLRRVVSRPEGRMALLRYGATPGQKLLLQRYDPYEVDWINLATAVARRNTVDFIVRPAPGEHGPFYRAIIVDYRPR